MEFINTLVNQLNGVVWGPPMLVLILGTGLFLMLRLKFMPLTKIGEGFKLMMTKLAQERLKQREEALRKKAEESQKASEEWIRVSAKICDVMAIMRVALN